MDNPALHKAFQGVLPLSSLPFSYSYNRHSRYGKIVDRTHFWISISDPASVFDLIQLDAHDPPEDLWGMALLKVASLKKGGAHSIIEELEFVFDLPYQPKMMEQLDQWFVRLKEARKDGD